MKIEVITELTKDPGMVSHGSFTVGFYGTDISKKFDVNHGGGNESDTVIVTGKSLRMEFGRQTHFGDKIQKAMFMVFENAVSKDIYKFELTGSGSNSKERSSEKTETYNNKTMFEVDKEEEKEWFNALLKIESGSDEWFKSN
jgi:hypothetical protein